MTACPSLVVRGRSIGSRTRLALAAVTALLLSLVPVAMLPSTPAAASGSLPCDIYAAAGTPCVSADSTVRALFSAYAGNLYQVKRASDNTTINIGVLSAGGYANAAAQDTFCANTTCIITEIYDQTTRHNDLTIAGPGQQGGQDVGANAAALPVTIGGHAVYGIDVTAGVGYRHTGGSGVATNGQPEGMYMVAGGMIDNGTRQTDDCCYDYGNVEATETDTGAGHMDAVSLTTICGNPPCTGAGPWVTADFENGLYQGNGSNTANLGNSSRYVTAMLKNNGQTAWALKGGNAQSGSLSTWYQGPLPSGYSPMHQEGSIVLGTGGDNSNRGVGTFFEGVMTSGYPTDAADNAVQTNIVAAGYAGDPGSTITEPGGQCMDVSGDDNGGNGAAVQLFTCYPSAADEHWTHPSNGTLVTLGKCLDTVGGNTANGTQLQLANCSSSTSQVWTQQSNGTLLNQKSGRCVDDPNANNTNGTRLQIWDCSSVSQQRFTINNSSSTGGAPTTTGGFITDPAGKCVDVAGNDTGGDGAVVQLYDCYSTAADQHWTHQTNGTLTTLNRCLDTAGGGTTNGTLLQLATCSGAASQTWTAQANGSLLNTHSGRCVDDPNNNTSNGVQLQIWDCNGTTQQMYTLH